MVASPLRVSRSPLCAHRRTGHRRTDARAYSPSCARESPARMDSVDMVDRVDDGGAGRQMGRGEASRCDAISPSPSLGSMCSLRTREGQSLYVPVSATSLRRISAHPA